jgi:hypothetical protein
MRITALAVTLTAATALALSACGSPDSPEVPATTTTVPTAAADIPPLPSAAAVNEQIARAFDPAVAVAEKLALIEGVRNDPALAEQISETAAARAASFRISDPITDVGGGVFTAPFVASIDGTDIPGEATFVAEDGVWKLSKGNACGLLAGLGLVSDQCSA